MPGPWVSRTQAMAHSPRPRLRRPPTVIRTTLRILEAILVLVTAVIELAGTGRSGETAMSNDIRAQLERAVEAEHGWKSDEVAVRELSSIQMPPCRFFNVVRKDSKEPFGVSYAALPNGELVSAGDKE